jgi:cytoskeletal protein RodZ
VLTGLGAAFTALILYGAATDGNGNASDTRPNGASAARPLVAAPSSTSSSSSPSAAKTAAKKPAATKTRAHTTTPSKTKSTSKPRPKPSTQPKPKPVKTHAPAPVHHTCTKTSSGKCIQGGEFCPQASYGRAGYDANGVRYVCKGDHTHPHWM